MPGVFIPTETIEEAEAVLEALQESSKAQIGQLVGDKRPGHVKLPRTASGNLARTFKTEEHTYYIIPPGDGIGFERWSRLSEMLIPLQFGMTNYGNVRDYWQKFMNETVQESKISNLKVQIIQRTSDFLDGIAEMGEKRYAEGAYLCTIFIVEENEDLTTWTQAKAEQKIEDWDKNGFDFQDFFLLAMGLSQEYMEDYQKRINQLKSLSGQSTIVGS